MTVNTVFIITVSLMILVTIIYIVLMVKGCDALKTYKATVIAEMSITFLGIVIILIIDLLSN